MALAAPPAQLVVPQLPQPEASSRLSKVMAPASGVGITVPCTLIVKVGEVPKAPDESQARM